MAAEKRSTDDTVQRIEAALQERSKTPLDPARLREAANKILVEWYLTEPVLSDSSVVTNAAMSERFDAIVKGAEKLEEILAERPPPPSFLFTSAIPHDPEAVDFYYKSHHALCANLRALTVEAKSAKGKLAGRGQPQKDHAKVVDVVIAQFKVLTGQPAPRGLTPLLKKIFEILGIDAEAAPALRKHNSSAKRIPTQ